MEVFHSETGWFSELQLQAAEMRTFLVDSLGGIWIVQRNRLKLIGRVRHISRAPACHSADPRRLIGSRRSGRALFLGYIYILVLGHLQMIAGFQREADLCVQCVSTELTWTFLLEPNEPRWDSWEPLSLSRRGAGGWPGERSNDQHHGVRRGRAEPDLHFLNEDPQLQDAERRNQAAQKPAGLLRAEERQAGLHQREVRGDLQDAAVRGGDDCLQWDPGAQPAGSGGGGRGGRGAGADCLLRRGGERVRLSVPQRRGALPGGGYCGRLLPVGGRLQRAGALLLPQLLHGGAPRAALRAVSRKQQRALQQDHGVGPGHACGDHGGERLPPPGLLLRRAPVRPERAVPSQEAEGGVRLLRVGRGGSAGLHGGSQTGQTRGLLLLCPGLYRHFQHLQSDLHLRLGVFGAAEQAGGLGADL